MWNGPYGSGKSTSNGQTGIKRSEIQPTGKNRQRITRRMKTGAIQQLTGAAARKSAFCVSAEIRNIIARLAALICVDDCCYCYFLPGLLSWPFSSCSCCQTAHHRGRLLSLISASKLRVVVLHDTQERARLPATTLQCFTLTTSIKS